MATKKDNRKRSIKSKLLAAICMLMVSVIMVVSSTYAWFTLSTAPEVTGISTAIGANGNLEMALLPDGTSVAEALGAVGNADTGMTQLQLNETWGNLVDLDDTSYGWDLLTLYPAKLSATGKTLNSNFLATPKYGADGRFTGLNENVSAATFNGSVFGGSGFGVRGVGTSSGLSDLENAYLTALREANGSLQDAISAAKLGISAGGSALAGIAIDKANSVTTFDQADISSLITAYTGIDEALTHVEASLKQYIVANYLSSGELSDETYLAALNTMNGLELKGMTSYADGFETYITTLTAMQENVKNTLAALEGMDAASYAWGDISAYVTALADVEKMLLNDQPITYWTTKDDNGEYSKAGELLNQMQKGLILKINATDAAADTGLYVQLADFIETYEEKSSIIGLKVGSFSISDPIDVNIKVYPNRSPAYLTSAKTEATTYTGTPFGSTGGGSLTDFYGYIVDMAFRTNVADSYLQLQTQGTDRIYADNTSNPDTLGGGSYMEFEVGNGYTAEMLENLMEHIRVVFFDPDNNAILGTARLDTDNTEYTYDADSNPVKAKMYLRMWDESANSGYGAWAENSNIVALTQNVATAVSTLVYLDGEELTNADVGNVALSGKMNIQFCSSAKLVPMEYSDLRTGGDEEEETGYSVSVNGTKVPDVTVEDGASYTLDISSYLNGQTPTSVVVKVGGNVVEDAYNADTKTISLTGVNGDVEITISFT